MREKLETDTETSPLVSIVIPVYNTGKYLAECLDSALSQTYSSVEVVCVNDGSTDDSLSILRSYEAKHEGVVVIDQKNSGVVVARNAAIAKAKGSYILPLDSDDKIAPNCVQELLELMKRTDYAVVAPSVEFFDTREGIFPLPEPSLRNMAFRNCIVNCSMFRKELWEKYGGFDEQFSGGIEDYDFWWNFLQDGQKIGRSNKVLFYYRIRNGELSRNQQTAHRHGDLIQIMLEKYPLMRKLRNRSLPYRALRRVYRISQRTARKALSFSNMLLRFRKIPSWRRYKNYVLNQQLDKSDFVPITDKPYSGKAPKKLIAYYLPQYYQIPQNDAWFGKGFTEWSNAAKAVPQYEGHWQPHLPIDVGFYNLETTHTMHRQVELAKMYGIHGFCFYYYWFTGGDKIMEKPINNWLNDKSLDFPFMFFWANEDWSNNWGEQAELGTKTYSAKTKPSDIELFVDDIIPFLKDKRYITIDGRPHIIIYQAKKDPHLKDFIKGIGDSLEKRGLLKPYVSLVFPDEDPDSFDPREYGADAGVEFGIHMKSRPDQNQKPMSNDRLANPLAKVKAYDMEEFIRSRDFLFESDYPVYKGAMSTFDNTARKIYTGAYFFSLSPSLYCEWLTQLVKHSKTDYIFLSAWNEWAEAMHLEPDQRFGYAYLQATKDALENAGRAD